MQHAMQQTLTTWIDCVDPIGLLALRATHRTWRNILVLNKYKVLLSTFFNEGSQQEDQQRVHEMIRDLFEKTETLDLPLQLSDAPDYYWMWFTMRWKNVGRRWCEFGELTHVCNGYYSPDCRGGTSEPRCIAMSFERYFKTYNQKEKQDSLLTEKHDMYHLTLFENKDNQDTGNNLVIPCGEPYLIQYIFAKTLNLQLTCGGIIQEYLYQRVDIGPATFYLYQWACAPVNNGWLQYHEIRASAPHVLYGKQMEPNSQAKHPIFILQPTGNFLGLVGGMCGQRYVS